MDPEIERRFDTVEGALVRLAEAQMRTDATVRELAAAQLRTEERVGELAAAQAHTEGRLATLTERVDRLAQLMICGHTDAAERHAALIDRLDKLEKR